jgi:hypothetical protein
MSERSKVTLRFALIALVAANALVFLYWRFALDTGAAGARIEKLQINAERVKLIAAATRGPGGQQAQSTDGAGAFRACLQWGPLIGPSLARAEAALGKLELAQPPIQRAVADAGGYWVYIPPPKNRTEVDQLLSEVRALGVVDAFVVQDPAKWRNAISLGIFKTDQAARTFLTGVQQRGVTSAVAERRENFFKSFSYFVREPDTETVAQFAELQRAFPGTEIRAAQCPFT